MSSLFKLLTVLFTICPILLFSCPDLQDTSGFFLHGHIISDKEINTTLSIQYINSWGEKIEDSISIHNQKFSLTGNIIHPTLLTIYDIDDLHSEYYLEPKEMILYLNLDTPDHSALTGSQTNDEFTLHNKKKEKTEEKRISINKEIKHIYNKISTLNSEETTLKEQLESQMDELDIIYDSLRQQLIMFDLEFAKENTSSFISLDLLEDILRKKYGSLYYLVVDSIFNSIDEQIKNSQQAISIASKLLNFKQNEIGSQSPDFILIDTNKEYITLSSLYENKIILLDFWASWCMPCREESHLLKELYSMYENNGFEIISITLDENLDAWKKAIKTDGIEMWKHIALTENPNSNLTSTYSVPVIPTKILIDKKGIIVARWQGTSKENREDLSKEIKKLMDKN